MYEASKVALRFMSLLLLATTIDVLPLRMKGASLVTSTCSGWGTMLKSAVCPDAEPGRRNAVETIAPVNSFRFIVLFLLFYFSRICFLSPFILVVGIVSLEVQTVDFVRLLPKYISVLQS